MFKLFDNSDKSDELKILLKAIKSAKRRGFNSLIWTEPLSQETLDYLHKNKYYVKIERGTYKIGVE